MKVFVARVEPPEAPSRVTGKPDREGAQAFEDGVTDGT